MAPLRSSGCGDHRRSPEVVLVRSSLSWLVFVVAACSLVILNESLVTGHVIRGGGAEQRNNERRPTLSPLSKTTVRKESSTTALNDRPIIGILAQPTGSKEHGESYIAASYVKWIEGSGARVVPIPYDLPQPILQYLFNSLNGLLFPGGGTNIKHSKYADVLKFFFEKTIEANSRGEYFPLWGTCLGFESLNILAAENNDVVNYGFDSEDLSLSLKFVSDFKNSRLFGSAAPNEVVEILAKQNVTMNNHMAGVTPNDYDRNEKLRNFFKILSLNADRKGKVFVSTIESFNFPIYATQYHPEKVYEFNYEAIDHSYDSLIANEYFGRFFSKIYFPSH
ncbi:hypothetical protein C9374_007667 [Naegleria lovaniensis]|uniref:folate gamma-glutamyl hydrolase n=1 Tax=Naegleria lovaniensis TaxID=51637 RepID=A0AA88GGK9_NAELO|nr:uncharacterized protein C9374_007667 [Naegleria lovaniensis]KAG2379029.1 hypothetical protein C9374_007667 [Naegleria lovaniensis]